MEIKFYEDTAGRVPVIEFLDSLDIKMRQKTPPREIERAKKIRDDYIERFGRR